MTAAATGPPDHGQPLAGASDRTNRSDFGGPMVQVCGLGKRYGAFTALDECSLEIQPGEIFGLLGPNGAGKTTLLRCLLGFLRPTSGWAKLAGYDCWSQRTLAHQQLSYMPAQPQLPRLLRARDVLRFFAEIRPSGDSATGSGRRAATRRFERACQLADRLQLDLHRWVALMSTGMRQKLAIAATLCADVPLVFLDEPTANLDPDVRSQLLQELAQLRREGTTVVFSSHVLSEIEQVCDRVAVLAKGRLVGLSNLAQLRQGSVIAGRFSAPFPQPLWDPTLDVSWESADGHDFRWRTYRRLESILPDLLAAGVQDLKIQTLGLLDVYHQHLAYSPPGTASATTAEAVAANGPSRAAATRVGSPV